MGLAMPPREQVLEARIARIKTALVALGALRPGTLSAQYNVCGKPGCRCKADPPQKHGPYYQVSFTWQGNSHSEFVRREELATVRQQVGTYRRFRSLVDAWIAAALELSHLQRHAARARRLVTSESQRTEDKLKLKRFQPGQKGLGPYFEVSLRKLG